MSCLGLLPPFQEETHFLLSTDERRESSGLRHIQATGGTTLPKHLIDSNGLRDTSERLGSQVLTLEIALDQAIGRFTDSQGVRGCESLNSRCDVGSFSEGKLLLPSTSAHSPHNDQTRMYP